MTDDLQALGWTARFEELFAPYRREGLTPARVGMEHTHIYRVLTGRDEWLARVAGRLRHHASGRADFPTVGDWVAVEPATSGDARIKAVLPRTSRFSRRAAGDATEEQVVAANIDTVFLVGGLDHDFNPRRLERYLVVAWESGATPVIVLNKADLVDHPQIPADEVRALAPGVDVHAVSTRQPETLAPLQAYLTTGRTGALLGMSGVGKSTIVNRLVGHDLLRTTEVRESDSRGRHTSSNRQLVQLPGGGLLIDTPGMRELQLWDAGGLTDTFADVATLAEQCRFRDCRHGEEPGCAVTGAVAAGELPGSRLESFRKLAAEREHAERQRDERKRQGRIGAKAIRQITRIKDRT
jgi:ribosome biogenesis GTPase